MDSVKNQEEVSQFLKRIAELYHGTLSKDLVEKYSKIYDNLVSSRKIPKEELAPAVKGVKFIAHLAGGYVPHFVYGKEMWHYAGSNLCEAVLDADVNFIPFATFVPAEVITRDVDTTGLEKLAEITVYSPGEPSGYGYTKSSLNKEEVVSQIPQELLPQVVAFELDCKDIFDYNSVLDCYCYNVVLYGNPQTA